MDQNIRRLAFTSEQLDQLFGGDGARVLFAAAKSYAPVRIGLVEQVDPRGIYELARKAAEKLEENRYADLTSEEQEALDAVHHLVTRPSLPLRGERVLGIPPILWNDLISETLVFSDFGRSVGRLDRVQPNGERRPIGTGWFASPTRIVTNRHVVAQLCGVPLSNNWEEAVVQVAADHVELWRSKPGLRPTWDPTDVPDPDRIPAVAARIIDIHLHPDTTLDFAVLEVDESYEAPPPLPVTFDEPEASPRLYLIGYPAVQIGGAIRKDLAKLLFQEDSSSITKRIAPGQRIGLDQRVMEHDATTLAGSSGSPVFDLTTHEVVGLHFSGFYGERNNAIALWTLGAADPFVVEHGLASG